MDNSDIELNDVGECSRQEVATAIGIALLVALVMTSLILLSYYILLLAGWNIAS